MTDEIGTEESDPLVTDCIIRMVEKNRAWRAMPCSPPHYDSYRVVIDGRVETFKLDSLHPSGQRVVVNHLHTVPMAGETPDTFEAGEPSRKPMPEMLAAEACIKLLSREAGFADWWSTLGGMGQAHYHDAMGDLIRARMVDFAEPAMSPGERAASEVEAELAEITGARVAIREARAVTSKFAAGDIRAGHHADVVKTQEAKRALHLLGYDGDTLAQMHEDIKRTASLGNEVSRELLRQANDKRAMIGERR